MYKWIVGFIPGIQGWFNIQQSLHICHPLNKEKSYLDISFDAEKAFTKHQAMMQTLSKLAV